MLSRRSTMLAVMATLTLPAPVWAQPSTTPPKPSDKGISMEDARRIATENGVARIEEIKLRASDGTIIKLERERPASAKAGN